MIVLDCFMERHCRHSEYDQLFHDRVSALVIDVLPEMPSAFIVQGISGLTLTELVN